METNRIKSRISLLLISLALFSTSLSASSTNDELLSLSLTDLLKIKVNVASVEAQAIEDSPALVTVYSKEVIDSLGADSLIELARITPGYNQYQIFGEQIFVTRGQKAGSFNNNKHLILIDGMPFYQARAQKALTERDLPIAFAKQVEFLRGPASSLYGTGAFFGAIEIQTDRDVEQDSQYLFGLDIASEREGVQLTSSLKTQSVNTRTVINLNHFSQDATLLPTSYLASGNNLSRDDQNTDFLQFSHQIFNGMFEGVELGVLYSRKSGGMAETFLAGDHTSYLNELTWKITQPFIKVNKSVGEEKRLEGYLFFNQSQEKGRFNPYSQASYPGPGPDDDVYNAYLSEVDNLSFQLLLSQRLQQQSQIAYGIAYDKKNDGGDFSEFKSPIGGENIYGVLPEPEVSVWSAFFEWEKKFENSILVLGARYDKGKSRSDSYDNVSPKISYLYNLNRNWQVRANYAEALRAPGVKEYGLNQEVVDNGDIDFIIPDLKPESFRSAEISLSYSDTIKRINFVVFKNITTDALDSNTSGVNYFTNDSGVTEASGFEIDLRYRPSENIEFQWMSDYADAQKPDGQAVQDIPKYSHSFVLSSEPQMKWLKRYSISINHWSKTRNAIEGTSADQSVNWLNANFIWLLTRTARLNLKLENMLDEKYTFSASGVPRAPYPGRQIWLGYQQNW